MALPTSFPPGLLQWMKDHSPEVLERFAEALKGLPDEMLQVFDSVGMIGGLLQQAKQLGGVVHLKISDDGGLTGHCDYGADDPECPWRQKK